MPESMHVPRHPCFNCSSQDLKIVHMFSKHQDVSQLWRPSRQPSSHLSESPLMLLAVVSQDTIGRMKIYKPPIHEMAPDPNNADTLKRGGSSTLSHRIYARRSPFYRRWIRQTTKFLQSSRNLFNVRRHRKKHVPIHFHCLCYADIWFVIWHGKTESRVCIYQKPKNAPEKVDSPMAFLSAEKVDSWMGFSWEGWLMDGIFLTGSTLLISLEPASSLPVCLWRWWGWTRTCWAVEWEKEWTYSKAEKVDSLMGFSLSALSPYQTSTYLKYPIQRLETLLLAILRRFSHWNGSQPVCQSSGWIQPLNGFKGW